MLPIQKRLYFKQTKWALLIILVLGIMGSALQITVDWRHESKTMNEHLNRILSIVIEPAIQSAYALDADLAQRVTKGIIDDDLFHTAVILDDLGNAIAKQHREPHKDAYGQLTKLLMNNNLFIEIPLIAEGNLHVGKLQVTVDGTTITSRFFLRSIQLLTIGLIRNLLLSVSLLFLFYITSSKPLTMITSELMKLSSRSRRTDLLPIKNNHREDELGILVKTLNELWRSRNNAEKSQQERETYFRAVMEQSSEAIILTDVKGNIIDINPEACLALQYTQHELLNKNISDISASDNASDVISQIKAMTINIPVNTESIFIRQDGTAYPVEIRSKLVNFSGQICWLASIRDTFERKQTEQKLNNLAFFDELTQLPNRRLLQSRLKVTIANAKRHNHIGALLFLDLDRFKNINDSLGHSVGDQLLQEVSRRLLACLREEDTAARIGGDEFVIMLPELADQPDNAQFLVQQLVNRIQQQFIQAFSIDQFEFFITASIGISLFPVDSTDAQALIQQADTAMYRAKESGRNNFHFYQHQMQEDANLQLKLEKELHRAIDTSQLKLKYQPQVDLQGNIIGFESLIRWNHPELGKISPYQFIPIAEDTNLIIPIGQWVFREACKQLLKWQKQGLPKTFKHIAVNISPKEFKNPDFVSNLKQILEQTGVDAKRIELELTESMLIEDINILITKMNALKQLGLSFSIDDFGTGYSSLRYLKDLPLDRLKLDRSFVRDITTDNSSLAITNAIVAMTSHLGLDLIAEGVETIEEKDKLSQLGVSSFQGYLYSRAIEQHQVLQLLRLGKIAPIAANP